jgi:hypothetical protein
MASSAIDRSGPRPVIDYLTKDYEGFKQGMLAQIPLLLPEWKDRSESDFGVVLVELFAYAADILSYYQDRVANEAYLTTASQRRSVTELLRLIGYQIDPGVAASAYLHLGVTADVTVTGAQLPFQVKTAGRPGEADVTFEVTRDFRLRLLNDAIALGAVSSLATGTTAIALDHTGHALAPGDAIYLEQTTTTPAGARIRRSPMLTVREVRALSTARDEITWLPPLPEPLAPARTVLHANNVLATHGETVTDEPVHLGDGTPGQRFVLARRPITHLPTESGSLRRRSRPELEVRVDGVLWEHVDSFFASRPSDLHYVGTIDEDDRFMVAFGSGARGSVPPAGARIAARYRIGLGHLGNVGRDTLTVAVTSVPGVASVGNPFAAEGGADRESTDEARVSGPGSVIAQERAVTLRDYELLASGFPGVGKVKARVGLRGGYKVVQVYVAPEAPTTIPPPPPSDALRESLARFLEERMPANRMAGADVLDPIYVPVDGIIDAHAEADASRSRVAAAVRATLRQLLSFEVQQFGRPVRVGEIFAALAPTPGLSYVALRRLQRRGQPPPDDCGFADVPIAENEMAFEGVVTVNAFGGLA